MHHQKENVRTDSIFTLSGKYSETSGLTMAMNTTSYHKKTHNETSHQSSMNNLTGNISKIYSMFHLNYAVSVSYFSNTI